MGKFEPLKNLSKDIINMFPIKYVSKEFKGQRCNYGDAKVVVAKRLRRLCQLACSPFHSVCI